MELRCFVQKDSPDRDNIIIISSSNVLMYVYMYCTMLWKITDSVEIVNTIQFEAGNVHAYAVGLVTVGGHRRYTEQTTAIYGIYKMKFDQIDHPVTVKRIQ